MINFPGSAVNDIYLCFNFVNNEVFTLNVLLLTMLKKIAKFKQHRTAVIFELLVTKSGSSEIVYQKTSV